LKKPFLDHNGHGLKPCATNHLSLTHQVAQALACVLDFQQTPKSAIHRPLSSLAVHLHTEIIAQHRHTVEHIYRELLSERIRLVTHHHT